ncbi:amino acid permease [Pseudonocardia benzenivorans]|uniref:Amino acid permease-associated region n=1 Tax=Pseudonocardia dioxanivorans (strain ATCC 55486 / DSM 44775 / JCM 13855 / CB1190) TaxID=675635 RepID=F4CZP2_PSEUX|nr:amino acid permease-associated region [Pseudonocardia dioxanivorans CB1190]
MGVLSSLTRRLGTADAVALGLAAMLGAGVFAVFSPAAAAAGRWLLLAVALAAVTALCNAASAADLAVAHPESGGGHVYTREQLSPGVGRLAGVASLVGKVSSAAAAAGVFGTYVLPAQPLICAVVVIAVVGALTVSGVRWSPGTAWLLVGGTLAVLAVVVVVGLLGPGGSTGVSASPVSDTPVPVQVITGPVGVVTAAGLVFFAFAGYSRVATIGEELRDPERSLRRSMVIVFTILTLTYVAVAGALLVGLGADRVAAEHAPLVALVDTGQAPALGVLVRIGAAVASGAALLSVLVVTGRTMREMASQGELPRVFTKVGSRSTPWVADLAGAVLALVVALFAGPVAAITLSACATLVHYALIDVAALRLPRARRHWPAWLSALGLVLCVGLAVLLPLPTVLVTAAALAGGWVLCTMVAQWSARPRPSGD